MKKNTPVSVGGAGGALEPNRDGDPVDSDEVIDLTRSAQPSVRTLAAPALARSEKAIRNKKVERVCDYILAVTTARWTSSEGVVDAERVKDSLQRALMLVDPGYQGAHDAKKIVDLLHATMQTQTHEKTSRGVKRAIVDAVATGVGDGLISGQAAAKQLGSSDAQAILWSEADVCLQFPRELQQEV